MRREITVMGVHPNFATENEHVPEIERQIRVLKKRARACRHYLPFTYPPRLILIEMMHNASLWVNVHPPKGGVSTISPRSLITGIKFDYAKHCQISFGSYAQVHEQNQPTNTQQTRTIETICLGPTGNLQGGYKLYNLTTGKLITRRNWTALPMPMEVIAHVNRIGQAQGQPYIITFQYRHGHSVGDTDPAFSGVLPQLAGVVHDNDDDDIGPDDDTIGKNPPDNIGIYPPDPTPIEQEDPIELEYEQPLSVNNEPTDVNPITSTSDTTIDNPLDRSVRRSNSTPKPVKDFEPSFLGKRYNYTVATTSNPNFTFATIHPDTTCSSTTELTGTKCDKVQDSHEEQEF